MTIHIKNPDPKLLKALAEAGVMPPPAAPICQEAAPKKQKRAAHHRQHRQVGTPHIEQDFFWPIVIVILGCLLIACLVG